MALVHGLSKVAKIHKDVHPQGPGLRLPLLRWLNLALRQDLQISCEISRCVQCFFQACLREFPPPGNCKLPPRKFLKYPGVRTHVKDFRLYFEKFSGNILPETVIFINSHKIAALHPDPAYHRPKPGDFGSNPESWQHYVHDSVSVQLLCLLRIYHFFECC